MFALNTVALKKESNDTMETNQKTSIIDPIKTKDLDLNFVAEIKQQSGVNISR